jgi:DNA polymerase III subunit gamma/tau
MAYKVLYRKYRPQDFNDLYGQDNIKELLLESIKNDKIAHAYLFSGPRGTGKTSTAKLFAKAINCENCVDGIPCNKCNPCINYEESPDIIEIDAASNNGVDEIRNLRDNAKILPNFSKYKIYIIDEVHMLSMSAWNAFLKILEEPPKHVIFILATTEIQKVPITILSRCQRFNFKKINSEVISENIKRICKLEKIKIDSDSIKLISDLSDGGMRDALSILDQLSKENSEITIELINKSFGLVSDQDIEDIFLSIESGNFNKITEIFNKIESNSLDINGFISKMISYLYKIEVEIVKNNDNLFYNSELIKKIAKEISDCYFKNDALNLVKIILFSYFPSQNDNKIISREIISQDDINLKKSEKDQKNGESLESNPKVEAKIDIDAEYINELKSIRVNNAFTDADKNLKIDFEKNWKLLTGIQITNELLSLIEDVKVEVVSPTNVIFSTDSASTSLLFCQNVVEIENEYNKIKKQDLKFICLNLEEWKKEKANYIKNKSTKKYVYISETKKQENNKNKKIVSSAKDIFDGDLIEIK